MNQTSMCRHPIHMKSFCYKACNKIKCLRGWDDSIRFSNFNFKFDYNCDHIYIFHFQRKCYKTCLIPYGHKTNYCQLHHMDEFSVSTSKPPIEHCAVDKGWILRCVDGEFTGHTRLWVIIIYICHLKKNEIKKKHTFLITGYTSKYYEYC